MEIARREGEDFLAWKYRLLEAKKNGETDLDWTELSDILGLNVSGDHLRKTAYGILEAKEYYEEKLKDASPSDVALEIMEKTRELQKERVKLADERRLDRGYTRLEARLEVLFEEMKNHMRFMPRLFNGKKRKKEFDNLTKEGLALWSDWHYGKKVDNHLNKYNREIAKERIKQLTEETILYCKKHGITKLHVGQLGDIVEGQIHVSTRVASEIDVVQQTMEVSELLAEALAEISDELNEIVLYNIVGNHGRTINKKEDALVRDNFEYFIIWWLKERLRDCDNITFIEDTDGLIITDICGHKVALAHGNFERLNNPQNLNDMYGVIFNYICIGHFHHTHMKEISFFTDLIVNNSLCGTDEYAVTVRKGSKAMQKLLIFDEKGLEEIINIRF